MRVLIDADGCPVVNISIDLCRLYRIPCLLLCDTSHEFYRDGADTLVFDKGRDSVDYALVNRVQPGDLVITQDYGLASMCLARNARVLHQDGWEYTSGNIDALLMERHTASKIRASGGKSKNHGKRTAAQNEHFRRTLENLLQNRFQG